MNKTFRFLSVFLCMLVTCMPVFANDCGDEIYRRYNPDECSNNIPDSQDSKLSFATTAAIGGGALAVIGGTIALLSKSSSDTEKKSTAQPTLQTYNMVGSDIDSAHLSSIIHKSEYSRNFNEYNDIRLAYSLARGFTGKNSTIAVLDSGKNTWHGKNVAHLSSGHIAPDATVKSYQISDRYDNFVSYDEIADTIQSASGANIYNFSWSSSLLATQIKNKRDIERITSTHFINTLTNVAKNNDAIFVWAAGNDFSAQSSALSSIPLHVSELNGHIVNVVAWDSEAGKLATFSNACGITKDYCITAPGANIDSPVSSDPLNGTSFAAPIVSAAIAVIREAFPYMKSTEITKLLFATARDLGETGIDKIYGHGMLDLEAATRPVGATLVPISEQMTVSLNTARVSAPIGHGIKSKNLKFSFIDSFGRAFDTQMNNNIKIKNRSIGMDHIRDTNLNVAEFKNITFGFRNSKLLSGAGFLQTENNNQTQFIGISDEFEFGNNTIFFNASIGHSAPKASTESIITKFSDIYSTTATFGIKHGDFKLSIGIPETIINGNMYLHTPSGRANNGEYIFQNYKVDISGNPSFEYNITYKNMTMGFVDNAYGTDEIYFVSKHKIAF